MTTPLILGTRGSDLALTQARMTEAALADVGVEVRIEVVKTIGDKRPDLKLSEFSQGDNPVLDKGIFTKELEEALIRGEIDFAVHSLKDVPTELGDGFEICATLPRADISDVLLTTEEGGRQQGWVEDLTGSSGETNPLWSGKTVATSSVRRARQMEWLFPGIQIVDIRGNVPTRIRKLIENEEWDGILLARAGIERLGIFTPGQASFEFEGTTVHATELEPSHFLPAAGQGAVAMEIRSGNERAREALAKINHEPTFQRVAAERAFLHRLQAGCQTPVGAWTWFEDGGDTLGMSVRVFDEDDPAAAPHECIARSNPDDLEKLVDALTKK
ncbi:MAG: hydroxymethylbilane synthase [Verrucomicrobiales bacterium]|nr:hydroxymethylbilane synthase [Verrucomicrobiales bacterium]